MRSRAKETFKQFLTEETITKLYVEDGCSNYDLNSYIKNWILV